MNYYFMSMNEETLDDDFVVFFDENGKNKSSDYAKKYIHPLSELKEYIKNHPKCKIYKDDLEDLSEEAYYKYVDGLDYWETKNL